LGMGQVTHATYAVCRIGRSHELTVKVTLIFDPHRSPLVCVGSEQRINKNVKRRLMGVRCPVGVAGVMCGRGKRLVCLNSRQL
jgi:hypothetical protein